MCRVLGATMAEIVLDEAQVISAVAMHHQYEQVITDPVAGFAGRFEQRRNLGFAKEILALLVTVGGQGRITLYIFRRSDIGGGSASSPCFHLCSSTFSLQNAPSVKSYAATLRSKSIRLFRSISKRP
jgi:hypothetical protein